MYITAQKVRSRERVEGINSYLHEHRSLSMPRDSSGAPDLDHIAQFVGGYVIAKTVAVVPGGNHVLAYLDVAAPDDVPGSGLEHALTALRRKIDASVLPTSHADDQVAARFAAVSEIEQTPKARLELFDQLHGAIDALLPALSRPREVISGPYVVHTAYAFDSLKLWLPPVTLDRLAQSPARRLNVHVPQELLHEPNVPFDVLREAAKTLLGVSDVDIRREGGIEIVDPRTATVFATFK